MCFVACESIHAVESLGLVCIGKGGWRVIQWQMEGKYSEHCHCPPLVQASWHDVSMDVPNHFPQ